MGYLLIAFSLALTTSGQLLQKQAACTAKNDSRKQAFIVKLFFVRETYWAVTCLSVGIVLWLVVLYYMDVSKAAPFLSIGFVIVAIAAKLKFHEMISLKRWFGLVLIVIGLSLVAVT